ncbi:YcnI family copper-binding membrane protein [Modestobacter marinus]|uniref:YcnI family copper-binding membrane protein n=1 Tax=Modestobacter marinus TaxID=477641 RepID=UPI0021BBEB1D|nr:YcnI family protein [Modestobacter marinus]
MPLTPSRPARRLGVVLLAALTALAGLLAAGAGVASAHVTVSSADAAPGGYGKLTFRVPNESDAASTVGLRIQLPTDTPLTSVRAQPVPGWTVTLTRAQLPEPIEVSGGEVDEVVSVVEYRAVDGGGVAPGQFQEFALSGGPFPDAESLAFNVVQSYSDGSEVAWIEPTIEGQGEPEHPAAVLSLASADGGTSDAHGGTTETGAASGTDDGGNGLAVTALVVAVLGLVAGLTGLVLGLRARRRTVSS